MVVSRVTRAIGSKTFFMMILPGCLLLITLTAVSCQTEPKCEAIDKDNHLQVTCTNLDNFYRVITYLASSNKELHALLISQSPQLVLKREYFDKHPAFANLAELNMSNNGYATFNPEPFQGLNLDYLILERNNLTSVSPDMFSGLQSITSLRLNDNQVESIDADSFKQFKNLTKLYLGNNRITSISLDLFDDLGLLRLDLSGNFLTAIENRIFEDLTHLTHLDLSNNIITNIDSTAFQNLHSLYFLKLNDNKLSSLDSRLFEENPLIDLNLRGNAMDNLSNYPLNCSSLKSLSLNDCNITSIPIDYFDNIPNLYLIHLNNNNINSIEPGVFSSLQNLLHLYLQKNSMTTLNITSFSQFYPILKNPPKTVDLSKLCGLPVVTHNFLRPTVKLTPNPWECKDEDMIELRGWCEEYEIDFNEIFACEKEDTRMVMG